MSKTDNTRPLEFQGMDLSRPGYVLHHHVLEHENHVQLLGCDYTPENNFQEWVAHRRREVNLHCVRRLYLCGGSRGDKRRAKEERKLRRRQIRSQERLVLRAMLCSRDHEEFYLENISPERYGKETSVKHFKLE